MGRVVSSPFQSSDREHAAQSREAVLLAAAEVIADRGFEATRFSDISEASGVPIATLQYQFGSREDLLHAAFQYIAFWELGEMAEAMRAGDDAWDQLRSLMQITVAESEDTQIVWRSWVEFWRAAVRDPRVREQAHEVYLQWRGFVQQVLRKGVEQGRFDLDLDIPSVALQISAMVDGISVPVVIADPGLDELGASLTEIMVSGVSRIVNLQPPSGSA